MGDIFKRRFNPLVFILGNCFCDFFGFSVTSCLDGDGDGDGDSDDMFEIVSLMFCMMMLIVDDSLYWVLLGIVGYCWVLGIGYWVLYAYMNSTCDIFQFYCCDKMAVSLK